MNTKNNNRFQETDRKIKSIFLEELKKTKIEKITVSTICKKAQINRSTFYAHYDDIYDILNQISDQIGQELYDMFKKAHDQKNNRILGQQELYDFLQFIYANRSFFKIYFTAVPFDQLNSKIDKIFSELIYPGLVNRGEADSLTGMYYFIFFKAGLFAVIKQWLLEDCSKSPLEMTHIILKGINYSAVSGGRFEKAPRL